MKSAYHALWYFQHGRKLQRTDGLGATSANPTWEKVWKLNCPAKVKNFLWRTLHGTLPCNVVLANRHIPVRPTCPACKQGAEDVFHVLFRGLAAVGARGCYTPCMWGRPSRGGDSIILKLPCS